MRTAEGTDGRTVPESTGAEASWSPDGMRLLVWFSDRRAPGLQERISRISWSSDGRRILVTPLYGDSLLWSADGTAEPLTIRLGRRFAAEVVTA